MYVLWPRSHFLVSSGRHYLLSPDTALEHSKAYTTTHKQHLYTAPRPPGCRVELAGTSTEWDTNMAANAAKQRRIIHKATHGKMICARQTATYLRRKTLAPSTHGRLRHVGPISWPQYFCKHRLCVKYDGTDAMKHLPFITTVLIYIYYP